MCAQGVATQRPADGFPFPLKRAYVTVATVVRVANNFCARGVRVSKVNALRWRVLLSHLAVLMLEKFNFSFGGGRTFKIFSGSFRARGNILAFAGFCLADIVDIIADATDLSLWKYIVHNWLG